MTMRRVLLPPLAALSIGAFAFAAGHGRPGRIVRTSGHGADAALGC